MKFEDLKFDEAMKLSLECLASLHSTHSMRSGKVRIALKDNGYGQFRFVRMEAPQPSWFGDPTLGIYKQCVCLLHDTIEDVGVKYRTLLHNFGFDIAEAVLAISDVTPTRNREETNMLTWPRIRANPIALHVKLCDRIFNMETSLANKSHQLERYGNEYQGFRSALFNGEHAGMWEHLDGLYEQQLQTKR